MYKLSRLWLSFIAITLMTACSDGSDGVTIERAFSQATVDLPSRATPAHTPGTPGVVVSNEKLIKQFGGTDINLNNARYTRYFLSDRDGQQPDGIVVLVPGFEGGASTFYLLANNLLLRALEQQKQYQRGLPYVRRSGRRL